MIAAVTELVVVDAIVLLALALPDPHANKDYAMALLFAIDKGDVAPVLTHLCHHEVAAKLVRKVRGQDLNSVKTEGIASFVDPAIGGDVVIPKSFDFLPCNPSNPTE